MKFERLFKNEIFNLKRVQDAFDDRYNCLRFDKNERIIPFDKVLLRKFLLSIKSEDISGYPELGRVYRKVAKYLGISEKQLLLTSGSDLAIKSVFEACVGRGDNVILHSPSYAMYGVYSTMFGAEARKVSLDNSWSVDFEGMLRLVDSDTKVFAIENPNGFVGTKVDERQIEYCAAELKKRNVIFLLDEAYYYVENKKSRSQHLIKKYPNVVISQTFSKAHGLAGVRVGYLIADSGVMEFISRVRPMHEITGLAALLVKWVLDNTQLLDEYQDSITQSKRFLKKKLTELGILYRDTHTNFMLLYFHPADKGLRGIEERLKKEYKILIRRPFQELYLKGWSRICVGSMSDARCLINALKLILGER